jgi:alpha-methylacyl-CoA racemase
MGHDQHPQSSHKRFDTNKIILKPGQHTEELLREAGLSDREIKRLALEGVLGKEAQKSTHLNVKL